MPETENREIPHPRSPKTILFVCEYNSCRSQLAEALARSLAPAGWRILSAGLQRTVVSDEVTRVLQEAGVPATGLSSKSLDDVRSEGVDEVVVLAPDALAAARRTFPRARVIEWPMADPLRIAGGSGAVRQEVRRARDELRRRVRDHLRTGAGS
ncbi:MAG: arsenate reductase ArsC [Acidobacteria bacterium]|nr:arsenate reductase ArsC [Acidobacteriota bacterium]